jgi:hypothetical protein
MDKTLKTINEALESSVDIYIEKLKPFENHNCWLYSKDLEQFSIGSVIHKMYDINGINNFLIHIDSINSKFIIDKPEFINKYDNELIIILNCIMKASIESITHFSNILNHSDDDNYHTILQSADSCKIMNETFLYFHSLYNNARCLKNIIIVTSNDLAIKKKLIII